MDDEINLLDYIKVILKWKKLIITITIVSMLSAFVYSKMQPKMYKAEVTLLSMNAGLGGLAQALASSPLAGMIGGASGGGGSNVEAILKSRALARMVVESGDLKKVIFEKSWDESAQKWIKEEPSIENASGALQGAIKVKSADTISIQVDWREPKIAAQLANAYAKELVKFLNEKAINMNVQILDDALAPKSPYKPKTSLNLMIGMVLGAFLGVFIAFFGEYWKNVSNQVGSKG